MFERDDSILVLGFEYDLVNMEHMRRHGLDDHIVLEVATDAPVFLINSREHVATHLIIGRVSNQLIWTVAIMLVDDERDIGRPITGWESDREEVQAWRDAN